MSTMLTIPSGIQDPSYRYKMPKMTLKQESRLNGVKTNIFNLEDVASALRVPSIAIMKYFCAELGANMEQTSIIKGDHNYDVMLKFLDKFIDRYVLCKKCRYPELRMEVSGKDLKSSCNSCGGTTIHDSSHKAGKALVNHLKQGGQQKADITKKDKSQHETGLDEDEGDDDVVLDSQAAELTDEDTEATFESKRVIKMIDTLQDELSLEDMSDNIKVRTALSTAKNDYGMAGEMHNDMDYYICLCALFPPSRNIIKNWAANEDLFITFVRKQGDIGIEHFFQALILYFVRSKYKNELSKYSQTFMMKLVEDNILSEKFVIQWSDKEITLDKDSCVRDKKAEKKFKESQIEAFINWLKKTEYVEVSGGESDDDVKAQEEKVVVDEEEQIQENKPVEETAQQKKQKENIEKQRQEQVAAVEARKQKVLEDNKKKEENALTMASDTSARVDLAGLGGQALDKDDIDDL